MSEFKKPDIIEEEILLDPKEVIMCKTDKFGTFEFANEYFMEISGYEEHELMGKPMFCIQHPDMPEVIFKMMWEKLLQKENFNVVVKNIAKSGKFYWSITNFTFSSFDDGQIKAIYSKRVVATRESITFFNKLYKTLINIEEDNGIAASEKYLIGFLEERRLTYFSELMQQFYGNSSSPEDFIKAQKNETPKINKKELVMEDSFSIQLDEKPIASKEIEGKTQELQELQKQVEEVKNIVEDQTKDKKGFFQRMFGKTEEEIEADKKRNT